MKFIEKAFRGHIFYNWSKDDSFWWTKDEKNVRHDLFFAIFKSTSPDYPEYKAYTLSIGRLKIAYVK